MQATSSAPPSASAPSAQPAAPGPASTLMPETFSTPSPRTLTRTDIANLRAQRSELSTQLLSAQKRRNDLSRSLDGKTGTDRAGVEQHIAQLDERILQIERDMATTGRTLASAQLVGTTARVGMPRGFGPLDGGQVTAVSVVFTLFVLFPLALSAARLMWRRATIREATRAAAGDSARLVRLEQAVEAVAIEVERIAEGQRFVTKLMAERHEPIAIGGAVPEPLVRATPEALASSRRG